MPPKKTKRTSKAAEAADEEIVETTVTVEDVEEVEDEVEQSSKRVKFAEEDETDGDSNESAAPDWSNLTSATSSTLVVTENYSSSIVSTNSLFGASNALITYNPAPGRLSSLYAPEISLSGHESAVYSIAFNPTGQYLCSGSMDRQIFLWEVYGGDESNREDAAGRNYNVLSGHKNAVLQVNWNNVSSPNTIVSCSADKTVAIWDAHKGARTRKLTEHTAVVNSCHSSSGSNMLASGSDDCTVILWDARTKHSVGTFYHDYQVLSVCVSDDGLHVYSGGIDNIIRRFDTRMLSGDVEGSGYNGDEDGLDLVLKGHKDTVTGLALSPDGDHLLSNGMDATVRCWDVRPYAAGTGMAGESRCESVAVGAQHGAEKNLLRCAWSPDGRYVTAGSADRRVHVWDARDTSNFREMYYLPGHQASVNQAVFHPHVGERVLASCGSDKAIFVGEYP
jgi:Prp8 binding protein